MSNGYWKKTSTGIKIKYLPSFGVDAVVYALALRVRGSALGFEVRVVRVRVQVQVRVRSCGLN
jgi:hypothetical protein